MHRLESKRSGVCGKALAALDLGETRLSETVFEDSLLPGQIIFLPFGAIAAVWSARVPKPTGPRVRVEHIWTTNPPLPHRGTVPPKDAGRLQFESAYAGLCSGRRLSAHANGAL